MKIWHISDTHTFHEDLKIPSDVDMVIFSGDCSNPRAVALNEPEVREFLSWYQKLPIKYKIFVAGNHDTSIEAGMISREDIEQEGVIYLNHDSVEIEGIKIFGSPYTPTFGTGWAFNIRRDRLTEYWRKIPDNTNIIITHGPPKKVLDLSYDRDNNLEFCGCTALSKRIRTIEPGLVLFGHIHSMEGINNAGTIKFSDHSTIYSNGSVVFDGRFDKGLTSNGNIIEYGF